MAWLSKACSTRQELSTIYTALPKNSRGEITVESDNVYRSVFKFFQTFPQHPSTSYVTWFSTIWKSKQITCYEALWNIARNYDYAGFPSRHSIGIDLFISCFATALAWYNREDASWEYPMDQQTIPLLRKKRTNMRCLVDLYTLNPSIFEIWVILPARVTQQKADRKEKIRRKAYFTTRVPSQLDEGFSHLCCLANSRRAAFEYCSLCAAPFVCSTSWLALQRIGSRGRFLAWHEGQDETSCQGRYVQCMMFLHRWCMMMLLWGYTNYHKPVYSNSIFLKQCIVAITSHNNTTWSAISTPDVCRLLYRTSTRTDSGPVHFAAPSPGYLGQHLSDSCFDQSCAWSCSAELRLKTWMVGNIMLPIVF